MKEEQKYDLIVTIVQRGHADFVIDAARDAGATGSSLLHASGTNPNEQDKVLGVKINPEKDIILTLVKREDKKSIMNAIAIRTNLNLEGKGICFALPVNDVMGIARMHNIKKSKKTKK